jgi:vanillate O-demethylase ferredoxin subunit
MTSLELRVARIDQLTPRIRRLILATVDGLPVPHHDAGAHIELCVPASADTPVLHRAYSLAAPADGGDCYEIAVQLEESGTGGSRWAHGLEVGAVVTASAPVNAFPLSDTASAHLLLAGGIGITPILCMARSLHRAGTPFELHYAARSSDTAAYCAEVEALPGSRCWFDGGDPLRGMPLPGVIGPPVEGRHLYVCGPKGFIGAVLDTARKQGWDEAALHCELFSGALDGKGDKPFTVALSRSGLSFEVAVGKTVMDVMEEAGLEPMFDCRRGECGICVTQVIEGEADHRDLCLSARERDAGGFCTCVSRARTEHLVLDL